LRQRAKDETKLGLTEAQRRDLFKEIVAAEDRAQAEADRLYPTDISNPNWESNLKTNIDTYNMLADQYRAEVRQRYGITEEEQSQITVEGLTEGWPLD